MKTSVSELPGRGEQAGPEISCVGVGLGPSEFIIPVLCHHNLEVLSILLVSASLKAVCLRARDSSLDFLEALGGKIV